jgi:Flp pilus assembly protein TadG
MLHKFWKSEQGNYTIVTAIALVPIMAAVAGVVDLSSTTNQAENLQQALDATALAIGSEYFDGMTEGELEEFGYKIFKANLRLLDPQSTYLVYDGTRDTGPYYYETGEDFNANVSGVGASHLVTVSSRITHPGFVGGINWHASRRSVVKVSAGQEACVLALNPHASKAMQFQGSTTVDMAGCVIASNSDAEDSFYRGGSAQLSALCAISSGGAVGLTSGTNLQCGQPLTHQYRSFDPLKGVAPPAYGNCVNIPNGKTVTLSQGTFCNQNLNGNVTLNAGVYVFKGGQLNFNGNGSLAGKGVTIFLMQGATMTVNGNATTDLSPPTSGPYAGITIYQDRDNTAALQVNGTSGSSLTGYVYAPAAPITYTGNASITNQNCIRIIGDTITMTGNSYVKSNCTAELGNRLMYVGRSIALVQ